MFLKSLDSKLSDLRFISSVKIDSNKKIFYFCPQDTSVIKASDEVRNINNCFFAIIYAVIDPKIYQVLSLHPKSYTQSFDYFLDLSKNYKTTLFMFEITVW